MEQLSSDVPLVQAKIKTGIIYNLKSGGAHKSADEEAEFDDIATVYSIRDALIKAGAEVVLLEAGKALPAKLESEGIDIAFNIAEGTGGYGREAQIPALLNLYGIPFTGSDETPMCIALDKALTKRLISTYKVRTPKYAVIKKGGSVKLGGIKYPVIVKPVAEGSSKGISDVSIAENRSALISLLKHNFELYNGDMLVEEYIEGREFTVGVLGNGTDRRIFPPMEIVYKMPTQDQYHVYSYNVKQEYKKYISYECPANIDKETENEMVRFTETVCNALNCKDSARVDFRVTPDGKAWFIEVNPLPGLAPGYSDFPMLAEFCGMEYDEVVKQILLCALKRYGMDVRLQHVRD